MTALLDSLSAVVDDLCELNRPFALVGGLAVSLRAEPRFTRDADLVVSVGSDVEAEMTVNELIARGYSVEAVVEHVALGRLATARLQSSVRGGVIVDLLFASSGIEPEIACAAETLVVARGLTMPVARVGHLIALKLLSQDASQRRQDLIDLDELKAVAVDDDWYLAADSCHLITARGYHRSRDLIQLLADLRADPLGGD
jgi:Nucleotidyl transferase AbiEii toxin, Type IV TA system